MRNVRRTVRPQTSHMINDLPDNIIESILMCLSTRDAARTSILSKKWRYRWAKLPKLILDKMFWTRSTKMCSGSATSSFAFTLSQIILLHRGPIKKFTLFNSEPNDSSLIDNLIFFLSKNGIEDLILDMDMVLNYRLPFSIFTCQQLRHLNLRRCSVHAPVKGFHKLITLKLSAVNIKPELLESLISSCPLLELLELLCNDTLSKRRIEIDAPNLKTLISDGSKVILKNVPALSDVTFLPHSPLLRGTFNFVKFFENIRVIKKLHLNHAILKSLNATRAPNTILTTLVYLQELKLSNLKLDDDKLDVLSCIHCLIRSSPNLKHVDIEFPQFSDSDASDSDSDASDSDLDPSDLDSDSSDSDLDASDSGADDSSSGSNASDSDPDASNSDVGLWELVDEQSYSDISLNQLKVIKMLKLNGTMTEMELIKFLLANSPSLKRMVIQPQRQDNGFKIVKELIKFRRASSEAEVIYVD